MDIKEHNPNWTGNRHPWEIARYCCIRSLLNRVERLIDFGAGDLYSAESLLRDRVVQQVDAVDIGCETGELRPDLCIHQALSTINQQADGALLLDVLEHLDNERDLLVELKPKVRSGARLIITVPAWGFLYSDHDRILGHFRRYSLKQVEKVVAGSGYRVEEAFYFFSGLFFVRACEKLLSGLKSSPLEFSRVNAWRRPAESLLTRSLVALLVFDFKVCRLFARFGVMLPGLSLCIIARNE